MPRCCAGATSWSPHIWAVFESNQLIYQANGFNLQQPCLHCSFQGCVQQMDIQPARAARLSVRLPPINTYDAASEIPFRQPH